MKRSLLLTTIGCFFLTLAYTQNVFNPSDPIIRYNAGAALGSSQRPNPAIQGLQKWVTTSTAGISSGSGSFDASSYKAYFININGSQMAFRLKFPRSYNNPDSASKKYPMTMFLHGSGEAACPSNNGIYNNEKQLLHGGELFRNRVDNNEFDGFLIYPQALTGAGCWSEWGIAPYSPYFKLFISVVDSLVKYARADVDRLFVNGLSNGGKTTFYFATVYPERVAAAAPSSAATTETNYSDFVHVPIWFASGGTDNNPTPGFAAATYNGIKNAGANIRWTLYEGLGHGIWTNHWMEPGYVNFMSDHHKANPLVFFQRNEFCPDSVINVKLGISPRFHSYEWRRGTELIAMRNDSVNNIVLHPEYIISYTGNDITVKAYGTYSVRFKRTATSEWSVWSPKPAEIKPKGQTQTPAISITGLRSKVLPAPDGSKSVPLELPPSFLSYQWVRANDNIVVSTQRTFTATVGEYKAKTIEQFGCGSLFSPIFKVVDANGAPKPDPAKNLAAFAASQTSIRLDWNENPNAGSNETGFEIYRSTTSGGPYTLINITAPNVLTYTDAGLPSNKTYYYIVRAVNDFGAAAVSNEATVATLVDNIPPTAPTDLQYRGSTSSTVDLRWTASTDNVAVDKYDVFVNGVKTYTTTNTSITVSGLSPLTLYNFTVKARDAVGNYSPASNQEPGYTHNQGLNFKHYLGTWSALPNFSSLTPASTGVMYNVFDGTGFRTATDNFAFLWEGYIYIPATGSYTFETNSDDGSRLYVDLDYSSTATALVNNDGLHGPQFVTGTVSLNKGYHKFVVSFFEAGGGELMEIWWTGPATTRERIPQNFLSLNTLALPAAPAVPTALVATAPAFNRVNLSWTHNSANTTAFEIVRATAVAGPYLPIGTVPAGTTSLVDTNRTANTQYHYRVRAVNAGSASAFTATTSVTTPAAPPAPAAPSTLALQVVGTTSIRLTWNDLSNNETGFEVQRSVGNGASFRLLTIVPGGSGTQKTFLDTALFANVTYFYRVRAVGSGSASAFSNTVSARTLNTRPSFKDARDFTMKINTTYAMPLHADDVDGDALIFTTAGLPYFGSLQQVSNGNANLVFNPSTAAQGAYSVKVYVNDGNGGKDTTSFTIVVNENAVPTMTSLSNMIMEEGDVRTIPLAANDQEGNADIFWYFTGKPSFVSFTDNGNGRGILQIRPGYASAGIYSMTVFADDGYGAWTSSTFSIQVNQKDPNESTQVNMKYFTGGVAKWNDVDLWTLPKPFDVTNLKNTKDSVTTIRLTTVGSDYEANDLGYQSPSNTGVFPNNIMKDQIRWGFFAGGNHRDTLRLRVRGLDLNKKYNFIFFGSSTCTFCGLSAASTTTYNIGNQSAVVNYFNNGTMTDTIYQVLPDATGEILITMVGDPNPSAGGVLNALIIQAQFDDGSTPRKPLNLEGRFVDNSGVRLDWTDDSFNENTFQVYRSTSRSGPYTLVNGGMNLKDSIGYTDSNTLPFTQYYYYVAGANNAGVGPSSDTVAVRTGNNRPKINNLGDLFVKSDATISDDFSVSDDAGDVLTVTIPNKPAFITLTSLGGNNYRFTASPTVDNIDWHKITVQVTDDKGGVSSQIVSVTVADKRTRTFFVNLGNFGMTAPAPWNNWIGYGSAGSVITGLKDETNQSSAISVELLNGWQGITDMGHITGYETGVFPDAVLQSGIWDSAKTARQIRFNNLNPALRYNLVFVGSQNEGMNAIETYTSGTQTSTLNARYNTNKTANLNGLAPSAAGQIVVNVTANSGNVAYLNGIAIEEYASVTPLVNPLNMYVEPRDRTSVSLSWSDRSTGETGFELQRATNATFTTNLVSTTFTANTTATTVTGLTPNTKYWFRVRATNGTISDWSNAVCSITPEQIVYVNFNFTVPNAPFPWNNTETQPNFPGTFENLRDQSGVTTGITLSITRIFNGEFNAGMNTGNNSGVVPDEVLMGNYWLDNGQQSQMKVTGLNQSKKYRFGFIGSSGPNGWYAGNYTATYTINGRTVYLNSWQNTSKIVYMGNVTPDSNGEVLVNFSTTAAALYGFNGGIIIEAYNDAAGGTVLTGELITPVSVEITPTGQVAAPALPTLEWKVSMYPNPFTDNLNIDFNNTAASNQISVDVIDLSGKLVHRRVFGKVSQGYTTLRLNAAEGNIGTGAYFIILNVNGKPVSSGKLIRTRQ